jgi:secreted trypsin-like serine protease
MITCTYVCEYHSLYCIKPRSHFVAAHCFDNITKEAILKTVVTANRFDLEKLSMEEGGVDFQVVEYVIHEKYKSAMEGNDIALLHLEPLKDYQKNLDKLATIPIDATDGGIKDIPPAMKEFQEKIKNEDENQGPEKVKLKVLFTLSETASGDEVDAKTKEGIENTGIAIEEGGLQEAKNKADAIQKVDQRVGANVNLVSPEVDMVCY